MCFYVCRLTTYLDSNRVFTWLSYFGYSHGELESQLSTAVTGITIFNPTLIVQYFNASIVFFLFEVTRSKDVDLAKKHTSRTVFRCNVIGPPGSGRVSIMHESC